MSEFDNDSQDSMIFDTNYNEAEYLGAYKSTSPEKKLSIMDDFGELCQQFNSHQETAHNQDDPSQSNQDFLKSYYDKLKKEASLQGSQPQHSESKLLSEPSNQQKTMSKLPIKPNILEKANKKEWQRVYYSSADEKTPKDQQGQKSSSLNKSKQPGHNKNHSAASGELEKDQRDVFQVTKLHPDLGSPWDFKKHESKNAYKNESMKDYFGEDNFVKQKVHGRHFINHCQKHQRPVSDLEYFQSLDQNQRIQQELSRHHFANQNQLPISTHSRRRNSTEQQNDMQASNLKGVCEQSKAKEIQAKDKVEKKRPQIVIYNKCINLTENIKDTFVFEQMRNDYQLGNQTQSTIDDQGLFAKAINRRQPLKEAKNQPRKKADNNLGYQQNTDSQKMIHENHKKVSQSHIHKQSTVKQKSMGQSKNIYTANGCQSSSVQASKNPSNLLYQYSHSYHQNDQQTFKKHEQKHPKEIYRVEETGSYQNMCVNKVQKSTGNSSLYNQESKSNKVSAKSNGLNSVYSSSSNYHPVGCKKQKPLNLR